MPDGTEKQSSQIPGIRDSAKEMTNASVGDDANTNLRGKEDLKRKLIPTVSLETETSRRRKSSKAPKGRAKHALNSKPGLGTKPGKLKYGDKRFGRTDTKCLIGAWDAIRAAVAACGFKFIKLNCPMGPQSLVQFCKLAVWILQTAVHSGVGYVIATLKSTFG